MPIALGDTFLMPVGGSGNHLFVVCTIPCNAGKVVLANVSSWKGDHCDDTVRLAAGSHPFLTLDSYVIYNYAEVERTITIEAGVAQGRFIPRDRFQEPSLSAIIAGLLVSPFTPRKVKRYLQG